MDPSSMVLPSASMTSTLANGHQSPVANDVQVIDENPSIPTFDNLSDLSETSPDEQDASDEDADHDQSGDAESDAAEEFNPEMSSDSSDNEDDLDGQASPAAQHHIAEDESDSATEDVSDAQAASFSGNSSTHNQKKGTKRKSPIIDDDFIRNNPSLYGLRRSGRSRSIRQNVQTTSDSDSEAVAPPSKRRRRTPNRPSKQLSRSQSIDSVSDSDSDEYQGSRSRTSKAKRRRMAQSSDNLIPAHAEIRFSTRRANRVSNYNEDDDDDDFEDESEMMTPGDWVTAVDDTTPAIDVVLNHRFKEGIDLSRDDLSRDDFEFYIKWQGKSHYHATWETVASLASCRSVRRLDNYIRKILTLEIQYARDPEIIPEEKEKWNLDRERDVDAIEDYKKAERVIGSREIDGETEYYVKWKRLFYDYCTWEPASLVSEIAQREIDRYLDRTSHPPISSKSESNPLTRAHFEPIHGTPSFVQNGELKEFQVKGVNFMAYNWVRGRNVVLADEMGLGKTVQTVAFINWLRHVRNQQGPFIVVVPLSTMPSWAETFDNWTPDLNYVVYNGNEAARNIIKEYELLIDGNVRRPKFHVLLTTYEYVLVDATFLSQIKWQFMAVDEAHRLKNRESQLYAKLFEFKSPSRLLITGTPVQNNLGELSALMDFLNPGLIQIDEDMDLGCEAASVKLAELTKSIQPYMLRRTKSKVESDLPPKSEKIIRVELSDIQLEYYKNILTKNYAALNQGSKGQKQSLLNIMMELKKASNHPFMFPNAESRILEGKTGREEMMRALITSSGKMMLLDQLLAKLKKDGHRVLIFSQMVRMLDILADYMDVRGYAYQRLDGTIAAGPRRLSIEHFNAPESNDFAFLLSTRAGGLGINLMTADTVVLFDSDWNPQADLQAMARAHRIGQTRPVSVYRLVSKDTVEEEVLERARNKLLLEFITIQRGVTDKEATELKDKMTRAGHQISEPTSSDDISRILKRRGQRMFEQSGNQKKLEELDIDSVLANAEEHRTEQPEGMEVDGGEEFLKAFEFVDVKVDELTWDDIIPREELEQIKAEEERRAHEQFLAQEIERSQPRKRKEPFDGRQERQAKRRARQQVNIDADDVSDAPPPPDPSRPLSEKEYRHLIRAYLRYGDINDRQDDLIREARLSDRDIDVVKAALAEVIEKAHALLKEENNRLDALEREGKSFTKKERKAILFDHQGVKRLNAETIVERPNEMRILRNATADVADPQNFRVPEATKGADYTCAWGAREDGMLCVGIARHGYGAWTQIRDDPDLALADKLFLEEHRVDRKAERMNGGGKGTTKSPGAVHLVRRADYLLSVLKDKISNGASVIAKRAVDNHHRNNKKNAIHSRGNASGSVSASPSPSLSRKARDSDKSRSRVHKSRDSADLSNTPTGDNRPGHGSSKHRRLKDHRRDENDRDRSGKARMKARGEEKDRYRHSNDSGGTCVDNNSNDAILKVIFKPVQEHLRKVSQVTKENIPSKQDRAGELRRLLLLIGRFIRSTLDGNEARASLEDRLWGYAATYWPNKATPAAALHNMFDRLMEVEKAESTQQR
ncbi:chromodomain-helicase-DNA-binding protein 1, variant 1 [Blastomyces gilchristii SLH14081]|uniref:Chromodomain-helicase-DNA-binding protein 1 n=2 Tax=Blastomyces gilchristii (strain SLH14081) TaxID=559298 RepID=A0A179UQN3_BLAGS|nr:chromodomain-helicase-DNA-binding protein 1 [Blastomyces gilchristii SLH14081]XP_031579272.1 chromodomain-helicase-DNA-binding protein 1, variant 1 [Blastomyces gilchristii SLH14081]OAT10323.1 chromodomain-helicase-DNA-binding protein 1 [Blastomyces gilchristii SLH14081]OAT10324.1 chromodomain-helicase-DNA-binding protein 1, variant 1 [Blastomyces gilchristii SLH14081]